MLDPSHFPPDTAATDQPDPQTLVDVIDQAAAAPAREALVFLNIRGEESESVTYGALSSGARRLAANLQHYMQPGQAVLLAVEAQADFIFGFCGATLAGVIPAPVAPLRRKANAPEVQRILQILSGDGITHLIVDRGEAGRARAILAEAGLGAVTVLDIGVLRDGPADTFTPAAPGPEAIAYLQYTSGSTAAPKGVVMRHRNVLANLRFMKKVFARTESVRVASWLPLHHDMGLVGHLFTILYERGFGVFMPPAAFLADPGLWLAAVHRYRANLSAAPNFALEHCVRKARPDPAWDLSCWKYIFIGSETVSLPVLKRFAEMFGPYGVAEAALRPVYGLAEATLLAAGGAAGLVELVPRIESHGPQARQLLPYFVQEGLAISIRDPHHGAELPAGESGEIWIEGDSVSPGYFGTLPDHESGRLATGDLGYLRGGALYVTGRLKEIVVIRGQNHSVEDIELVAAAGIRGHAPHHRTACVADIGAQAERLVVFQEVARHLPADQARAIHARITANLTEAFGIAPAELVLLPAGLMPRTPNNKIARAECLRRYRAGELRTLHVLSGPPAAETETRAAADPVVIVGMACRFPGAEDPEQFWQNLAAGADSITEVPATRWDNDLFYDANPAVPGKVNTKWGGFLADISHFDPEFFGISTLEAPEIDPQQRLLLETSYRLLEDAGWKKQRLAGSATGVFVGISTNDYLYSKIKLSPGMTSFNAYAGLGNANSIAANRLSYVYDLRGPSMAVDTACSSSLTAFHLGAQAILAGECDQAIVGGVNATLSPGPTITLSQFGMMAPDGRCKSFDARADGYVRAEGCGLVMLKRQSVALADGDRILAVLEASATGQDGASTGITYPNGAAQQALIARALGRAGLEGGEISYMEAHGTGTAAGDPVEVEALKAFYGTGAECALGSVKANIGHLEAAAGIASVIKLLLMLRHREMPPQINLHEINPKLGLEGTSLHVPRARATWAPAGRRRAAISSFGFGGALAHILLAEPLEPTTAQPAADFSPGDPHPLVVSGATPGGLRAQLKAMADWLETHPGLSYRDICHSQAACRSDLRYRSAVLATSRKGAAERIAALLQAERAPTPARNDVATAFLFTGQGEHYLHMGRELYRRFALFHQEFDRCAAVFDRPGHAHTLAQLAFEVEDTREWADIFMQPILFAVQHALSRLLLACGVAPGKIIGHSLGEYAAASLAGCLAPEDAMRILHRRGELMRTLPGGNFMAVIFAARSLVEPELDQAKAQVAAVNSPGKTVISGDGYEVDRVRRLFEQRGYEGYFLKTSQAYHSHVMDPILEDFRASLAAYEFAPPQRPWVSTLTGRLMTAAPDAGHWVEHLRRPVLFSPALASLGDTQFDFIEIGPGASALAGARETLQRRDALYLRTLNPKKGERTESYFLLEALCRLYERGAPVDWSPILSGTARHDLLPRQVMERKPYWIKGVTAKDFSAFAPDARPAAKPRQNWHYTLHWREAGAVAAPAQGYTRAPDWLLVAAPGPLTQSIIASAKQRGEPIFWVNTAEPVPDWSRTLGRIFNLKSRSGEKSWKLLYLDDPGGAETSIDAAQARIFGRLIPLLQALHGQGVACPVWIATQNSQKVKEGEALNLAAAPLWGFAKTLFLEHPEWRGGQIDLSAADPAPATARQLLDKMLTPAFEACIALRGSAQYAQELQPAPLPAAACKNFRGDGAFIVTGGLGGLGLATAEWIVRKGGRHLILLGRTAPKAEVRERIATLQAAGANIETRAMDIRDSAALAALFAELDAAGVPVRGIVHAAGENWFGKVLALDSARFLETLRTKVGAAWELHLHTAQRDLDCFILFSSVSALWGSVELSHYTAANQFLDALSLHRAQLGLPSLSADWGPWAEAGMSANPADQAVLEKLGFALMPPARALAALEAAMAAGRPLSLIADMDWERFQLFIDFCPQPSLFSAVAVRHERTELALPGRLDAILAAPPDGAREMIEKAVRMELRAVTLIESSFTIDAGQRFNFIGMDSLMALSFAAALETYFRIELPSTLTYNYPTIRAVTDFIAAQLGGQTQALPSAPVAPAARQNRWFSPLSATSTGGPVLFCLPFAGSGASAFTGLAQALGSAAEVIGIQMPGREDHAGAPPFRRMDALIGALAPLLPCEKPFFLYGHSMGAAIAAELALALQRLGRPRPTGLIVSGAAPPGDGRRLAVHQLPESEFIQRVLQTYASPHEPGARAQALAKLEPLLRADLELFETHQPSTGQLAVPVAALHARQDPLVDAQAMRGWASLSTGDFLFRSLEGTHQLVTDAPQDLAQAIRRATAFFQP